MLRNIFLKAAVVSAMAMSKLALPGLAMASLLWTCVAAAQEGSLDEARRLLREGQVERALEVIDQRLAIDDSDRHARFLKGVALAEQSDTDAAIEVFLALTRDYPQLPEPYNNLAVLYASKSDYERARDALLQAINTHPSYATAHENLGDIYAKMAGLAYTRALSLDTQNTAAKDKLALIDDLFSGPVMTPVAKRPAATVVTSAVASAAPPRPVSRPVPRPAQVPVPQTPVPAAAPKPITTTAVAAAPVGAASDDAVIDTVRSWASAWSSKDVESYLNHYEALRSPDPAKSRASWEKFRRARLSKPGTLAVDVENFQIRHLSPEQVLVTFEQSYRSNNYADRVRKRLTMKRIDEAWKISDERTVAKL